jgi:hypothetical protein
VSSDGIRKKPKKASNAAPPLRIRTHIAA